MRLSILLVATAWLAAGCAGHLAAQRTLDWALGDWHGVRRAQDDGSEAPITVRVEALGDGSGQVERLQVDLEKRPYIGFTLRICDSNSGRWTMVYANSTRSTISKLDGRIEGDRSTWDSVVPDRVQESRFVSEQVGPDRWRRTQYVSADRGATWRVLFTDELERGKAPP